MKLVVGLGNPGPRYERTRHNVGFMVVDQLRRQHRFAEFRDKFSGECSKGSIGSTDVALLKPMTFMNESGRSVQAALAFYHINANAEETLVLHDELDLPFGDIRLKAAGGHAGHNGLRSIISSCGADFSRLRFGIGRPPQIFAAKSQIMCCRNSTLPSALSAIRSFKKLRMWSLTGSTMGTLP